MAYRGLGNRSHCTDILNEEAVEEATQINITVAEDIHRDIWEESVVVRWAQQEPEGDS